MDAADPLTPALLPNDLEQRSPLFLVCGNSLYFLFDLAGKRPLTLLFPYSGLISAGNREAQVVRGKPATSNL